MNQPIKEALPTPTRFLVAPARDWCMFFILDPKSDGSFKCFYPTLALHHIRHHNKIKKYKRLDYESSYETWNELVSNGRN